MVIREKEERLDAGTVAISFTYYPTRYEGPIFKGKEIIAQKDLKGQLPNRLFAYFQKFLRLT